MNKAVWQGAGLSRYALDRVGVPGAVVVAALGWLLAVGGLVGTIAAMPELGWKRGVWVVALCAAAPSALWLTRRAMGERRLRVAVPQPVLEQRYHGSLEAIDDSERRSLRPIAARAYDVAARTGNLLNALLTIPSVRIFRGVHSGMVGLPLIPHAISSGRQLILVESVAWPPGRYETAGDGRIHCDGTYIGQSVRPLLAAVQQWQDHLGKRYYVSAVLVVHTDAEGEIMLSTGACDGLAMIRSEYAIGQIRQRILDAPQAVSRDLVAALIAATSHRT